MQLIKSLSKSKVVKVLTLALVLAGVISGVNLSHAADTAHLTVKVFEGSTGSGILVSGAKVNLSNGQTLFTDGSGVAVFRDIPFGIYRVEIRANNYYDRNYDNINVDMDTELDADILRIDINPPPPPVGPDGCTPAPPMGAPMLNIWPINTRGADCTDLPLLMAKNLTQGTGYINGGNVPANSGDTIRVQLYVHNGVLDYPENEAKNVVLKANMNGNEMSAEAWADNANRITSGQKGGDIRIGSSNFTLSYVPGSAVLYDRGFTNGHSLSDSIVGSGASVGNMRGCFPFLHLVTLDVKVNGPVINPPPPAQSTIKVIKEVVNNNGGTASPSDFPLFVNGQSVQHNVAKAFNAGTYTVTETNRAGYSFVRFSGDCNSAGVINLAASQNAVCTVVNDDNAPPPPSNHLPVGYLDLVDCNIIGGWVFDPDATTSPITVQIFRDGPEGTGTLIGTVQTDVLRADVNAAMGITGNHGYMLATPASLKDGRTHQIWAYAKDTTTNQNILLTNTKNFDSSLCIVVPPVVGEYTFSKTVRNVTKGETNFVKSVHAKTGDVVEFNLDLDITKGNVYDLWVNDQLPSGLSFVPGSLHITTQDNKNFNLPDPLSHITVGTLSINMHRNLLFRVSVMSSTAQTLVNTATITSRDDHKTDTASVIVDVDVKAGKIDLTKHVRNVSQSQTAFVSSTAANPGDQVEFQMLVSVSDGPVNNIIFSDDLPIHTTYVNNSLTVDGVPSGNTLGAVSLGNMIDGQTKRVIIRATINNGSEFALGLNSITNTARVTSSSNSALAMASVLVTIKQTKVNLSIDKLGRNVTQNQSGFTNTVNANPGDLVQFQVKVTATGDTAALNVVLTDTLPNNMTFVSGSSSPVNIGTIKDGSTETVLLTAALSGKAGFVCGTTNLVNTASASSSNTSSVSDTASVVVTRTGDCGGDSNSITIIKLGRNISQNQNNFVDAVSANPGDTVQFQIQVTANGNIASNNVVVTDTLPANMSLSSGSLTQNLGNMSAGSNQTVNFNAVVASDGNFVCGSTTLTNLATATSSNANSVSDTASVVVSRSNGCGGGGSVSLNVTKEVRNVTQNSGFSNSVTAVNGDRVEFRIVVRANGTVNNVRVTDTLPNGLTYIPGTFVVDSGSSSGSIFNGSYQFLGSILGGSSRTLSFQATVNSSISQTLINTATATSDNAGTVNASATVFVSTVAGGNIDLILSKSAYNQTRNVDATTVTAQHGDVIVYTLRVRNQGNLAATNYVFTDSLSDVLQHSNLKDFGNAAFDTGSLSLTWPAVTIPANSTVEKTFSVLVNNQTPVGSDYVMTNVFGNTVNVRVPQVKGFVAPPTGPAGMISFILAFATVIGFWTARRGYAQSFIKFLTYQKNV